MIEKIQENKQSAVITSSILNPEQLKICRVCLMNQQDHEEDAKGFITPCKCSGSIQFAHHFCLKKWITYKVRRNMSKNRVTTNPKCQICGQFYKVKSKNTRKLKSCKTLKRLNQTNQICAFITLIVITGCLGVSAFFISKIVSRQFNEFKDQSKTALILGLCLLIFTAVGFSLIFVFKFLLIKQLIVIEVQEFQHARQNSEKSNSQKSGKTKNLIIVNKNSNMESNANLVKYIDI